MCWLKSLVLGAAVYPLILGFLSYCSGFINCLFVWLWSNPLLEKKKKSENLIWFLFFSCSCSCSSSGSCSCSCSYSGSCSCSCFLGLITSWDKTKYHDWVQLVLKELEWENSWGKRQESVRLLSKKKNSQLRVKYEWSAIVRV